MSPKIYPCYEPGCPISGPEISELGRIIDCTEGPVEDYRWYCKPHEEQYQARRKIARLRQRAELLEKECHASITRAQEVLGDFLEANRALSEAMNRQP